MNTTKVRIHRTSHILYTAHHVSWDNVSWPYYTVLVHPVQSDNLSTLFRICFSLKGTLSKQNVAIIPDLNVRAHRSANNVILAHSVVHNLYTACESLSLASQVLNTCTCSGLEVAPGVGCVWISPSGGRPGLESHSLGRHGQARQ